MSNKKASNQEADNLFQKIVENSLSLILSFIFSIGLIGGASYLLFDSQKDFLEFKKYEVVFTNELNAANVQCQICEINKNGWFSQDDKQAYTFELLAKLKDQKASQTLAPDFSAEVRSWCLTSLMQLSSEQGQIKGYLPDNELVLKYQTELLTTYEQQIFMLDEMKSLVLYWENETVLQRETRIENINNAILKLTSSFQSLLSINEQILAQYDKEQIELEQQFNEFNRQYNSLQTKRGLAIIGILVGLTVFIIISVSAYNKFGLKLDKKSKQDKAKKEKSVKK